MAYSKKLRESMLKRMLPPECKDIDELAEETGISRTTLYAWRKAAEDAGMLVPIKDTTPDGWTSRDKFAAVLETATMNMIELAEYCRKRGIYPEQVREWRIACESANDSAATKQKKATASRKKDQTTIRELKRELKRKDKALAETAAILVLRKKAAAIWGPKEDEDPEEDE